MESSFLRIFTRIIQYVAKSPGKPGKKGDCEITKRLDFKNVFFLDPADWGRRNIPANFSIATAINNIYANAIDFTFLRVY